MARKIQATLVEVPSHFMGKIHTQEKFDAHKREIAERIWETMRSNNSRECRECHSYPPYFLSLVKIPNTPPIQVSCVKLMPKHPAIMAGAAG